MKKQQVKKGSNTYYLLGTDINDTKYWLVSPSWDCDWYWGFGYIKTFERNFAPNIARDLDMHVHVDTSDKVIADGKNIFTDGFFADPTFSDNEGWKLRELFAQFYTLHEAYKIFRSGNAHVSGSIKPVAQNKFYATDLAREILPEIMIQILAILETENSSRSIVFEQADKINKDKAGLR